MFLRHRRYFLPKDIKNKDATIHDVHLQDHQFFYIHSSSKVKGEI